MGTAYQGGRNATNDLNEVLGVARAVELIQMKINAGTWRVHPETGCLLSTNSLNENGYATTRVYSNDTLRRKAEDPNFRTRNTGVNVLFHRVAYFAYYGVNLTAGNVGSHLCPFKACFLGEHIVDETQAANLDRINCAGVVRCPYHNQVIVDLCRHTPKCIKLMPPVSCCAPAESPPTSSSPAKAVERQVSLIRELDPIVLPGSQYLGAPVPEPDEEVVEEAGRPPVSSPLVSVEDSSPSAVRLSIPDLSVQSLVRPHSEISSSPVRPPGRRRRLNQPLLIPSEADSVVEQGSSSRLPTSDFVVPDDTQFIEYRTEDNDSDVELERLL